MKLWVLTRGDGERTARELYAAKHIVLSDGVSVAVEADEPPSVCYGRGRWTERPNENWYVEWFPVGDRARVDGLINQYHGIVKRAVDGHLMMESDCGRLLVASNRWRWDPLERSWAVDKMDALLRWRD